MYWKFIRMVLYWQQEGWRTPPHPFSNKQEAVDSGKNSAFNPIEAPESWEEVFDERNSISAEINIPDEIRKYGF